MLNWIFRKNVKFSRILILTHNLKKFCVLGRWLPWIRSENFTFSHHKIKTWLRFVPQRHDSDLKKNNSWTSLWFTIVFTRQPWKLPICGLPHSYVSCLKVFPHSSHRVHCFLTYKPDKWWQCLHPITIKILWIM